MLSRLPDHILREIYYYRWLRSIKDVNKEYYDTMSKSKYSLIGLLYKHDFDFPLYLPELGAGKFQWRGLNNTKNLLEPEVYKTDRMFLLMGQNAEYIYNKTFNESSTGYMIDSTGHETNSVMIWGGSYVYPITRNYIYSSGLNDVFGYKQSAQCVMSWCCGGKHK